MRFLNMMLMVLALVFSGVAMAKSEQQVRQETIEQLSKDGFITESAKREAIARYAAAPTAAASAVEENKPALTPQQEQVVQQSWFDRYVNLANTLKFFGTVLLIIVFWRFIAMIIIALKDLILRVPMIIYQGGGLLVTGSMTFAAASIWPSQAVWVAIFGAFGNLILLSWVASTYKEIAMKLIEVFSLKFPKGTAAGFWLMVYFGALAIMYQSQTLGFFAVVAFCAMLTFTIGVVPGVVFLNISEKALGASLVVHTCVLGALAYVNYGSIAVPHLNLWVAGLNYYLPIALGLGLVVGCSPWYSGSDRALSWLMLIVVFLGAIFVYSMAGMAIASVIVFIFIALILIEWLGYASFSAHYLVGLSVIGALLFFGGLWLEGNASWLWAVLQHGK